MLSPRNPRGPPNPRLATSTRAGWCFARVAASARSRRLRRSNDEPCLRDTRVFVVRTAVYRADRELQTAAAFEGRRGGKTKQLCGTPVDDGCDATSDRRRLRTTRQRDFEFRRPVVATEHVGVLGEARHDDHGERDGALSENSSPFHRGMITGDFAAGFPEAISPNGQARFCVTLRRGGS